jgi:hypothetical protein
MQLVLSGDEILLLVGAVDSAKQALDPESADYQQLAQVRARLAGSLDQNLVRVDVVKTIAFHPVALVVGSERT